MTVTAGVGVFESRTQPNVYVNRKPVPVGAEGLAEYSFQVPPHPGHYRLPVRIEFTDQDGKLQTVEKEVRYRVLSCPGDRTHTIH